jgi:hypothetical protein
MATSAVVAAAGGGRRARRPRRRRRASDEVVGDVTIDVGSDDADPAGVTAPSLR